MMNMEALGAEAAASMVGGRDAEASEKLLTQALMVLAEQGVYAFGLFLSTRKDKLKTIAEGVSKAVAGLLAASGLADGLDGNVPDLAYYRAITGIRDNENESEALYRLLLSKSLIETALTYARYHAKSMT